MTHPAGSFQHRRQPANEHPDSTTAPMSDLPTAQQVLQKLNDLQQLQKRNSGRNWAIGTDTLCLHFHASFEDMMTVLQELADWGHVRLSEENKTPHRFRKQVVFVSLV